MKRGIKKSSIVFALLVTLSIIFMFGFVFSFATSPKVNFVFTASDSYHSVSLDASNGDSINFFTNSSTVTIRVIPDPGFGSGNVLNKDSLFSQWQGTESIIGTKTATITSLPFGSNSFSALVTGQSPIEDASATINVIVQPTMTATASCSSSQPRVTLTWTDLSSTYSGVFYEIYRDDTGPSSIVRTSTTSFIDDGISSGSMNPNTPYTYSMKAFQNGQYIQHMNASVSVTTGSCGSICGNTIVESGEQCDNGAQNGVQCSAPYGGACQYCSNNTSPGGSTPQCQFVGITGPYCGDGTQQKPQEKCDDGNRINTDACTNICQNAVCGDGIHRTSGGTEKCDDGNTIDTDACTNSCEDNRLACKFTAASWNASNVAEGTTVKLNVTGTNCNGRVVDFWIHEQDCVPIFGCSLSPTVAVISGTFPEKSWVTQWVQDTGGTDSDPEYIFIAQESGNITNTFYSNAQLKVTRSTVICGNGTIDTGEQCDGTNLGGQSCTTQGFDGGTLSCNSVTCQFNTSSCTRITCGNGAINSGEQCDGGTGCAASCQCSAGFQPTSPVSLNCQPQPSCGNGICDAGENSQSCLQDCPIVQPQCQLTSAAWSRTQATEGQSVNLNVQGTNCGGKSVSFVVWEDDISGDDSVTTNPGNVVFSGNSATGSWIAEWQNDGIGDPDPEYYFLATVSGAGNSPISSGTASGQLLNVNQSNVIVLPCGSIATCGNYADSASCNVDACNVAANSVPSGVDCNDPNVACSCLWNVSASRCDANVGGPAGKCVYTQQTTDDCDDGFLTFSWTAQWTWLPGKTPADDPQGLHLQCVSGSKIAECPAQIALPFFNFYNIIVALIAVGLVYWVLSMQKVGKKRGLRKK